MQIYIGLEVVLAVVNGSESYQGILNALCMENWICSPCRYPLLVEGRVFTITFYIFSVYFPAEANRARFCLQAWAHSISKTLVTQNRLSPLMSKDTWPVGVFPWILICVE